MKDELYLWTGDIFNINVYVSDYWGVLDYINVAELRQAELFLQNINCI